MKKLANVALTIGTAALFAGCESPQSPTGASGALPKAQSIPIRAAAHGKSWMLPEAKSRKLVYIAAGTVYVYAYGSNKLVGTIAKIGDTGYECSDKNGNVFVPVYQNASNTGVYEYAHGGTSPINYLSVPGAWACAIDPSTGNLAVINTSQYIFVFQNASGSPQVYADSNFYLTADVAYDDSGNLFIDGSGQNVPFLLVEMSPHGQFQNITVSGSQNDNGFNPIAWDGRYLGLGSYQTTKRIRKQEVIERLAISGSSATVAGYTPLGAQKEPDHLQFWLGDSLAIQASNKPVKHSLIQYFTYPKGKLTKSVKVQPLGSPYGITVSVAPSR